MFPAMPVQANKQERQLVKLFKSLDSANKESLLSYAEFLQLRASDTEEVAENKKELISEPMDIPRPEEESVIKAIKRLTANYPMVNKENILHPISGLMTAHMLQGKNARKVIDELEELFAKEYENFKEQQ